MNRTLEIERHPESFSLYAGGGLARLAERKIVEIANCVSAELARHPERMIGFTSDELAKSIKEGRAACIFDQSGKPTAFAQYWPYEVDHTGDGPLAGLEIFEIGSWLNFGENGSRGQGVRVFEAVWDLGKSKYPAAGFIAIASESNNGAVTKIERMGGYCIGNKKSKKLRLTDGIFPEMKIYRMERYASS